MQVTATYVSRHGAACSGTPGHHCRADLHPAHENPPPFRTARLQSLHGYQDECRGDRDELGSERRRYVTGAGRPPVRRCHPFLERNGTTAASLRNSMIARGLAFGPAHGDTALTVSLFDTFMKRIMP